MRRRGTKRPRSQVNRGTELWWKGRFNTGGLCRPGWLGSTLLGSNHSNCNHTVQPHIHTLLLNHTGIPECTHEVTKEARTFPQAYGHSSHSSPRVPSPLTEGLKRTSSVRGGGVGSVSPDQENMMWRTGGAFRRHEGRTMGVSRNTSPVWCAAYARSPPRARAPSASAGSGPPPSGTTREASDASQSDAGFLRGGRGLYPIRNRFQPRVS